MTSNPIFRLPIMALLAALVACSSPPPQQDKFYRLVPAAAQATLSRPLLPGTLVVERFAADGLLAARQLIYSKAGEPNGLTVYNYHLWVEPPANILQQTMIKYLRQSGVATTIIPPDYRQRPDYILTGRINKLEQILDDPIRVVVELELVVQRLADSSLYMLTTYRQEAKVADRSVLAAVESMDQLLENIYQQFVDDLANPSNLKKIRE